MPHPIYKRESFRERVSTEAFCAQHIPDISYKDPPNSRYRQTKSVRQPDFYPSEYGYTWRDVTSRGWLPCYNRGHVRVNGAYCVHNPCNAYAATWPYIHRLTRKGKFKGWSYDTSPA